jgi:gamma-glutamylcyclotransferase
MDAHHDKVLRARLAADDGTTWYFAYSTILDRSAFDAWRAEHGYGSFQLPAGRPAEALDVSLVYDFPSRFWGGRVAGLATSPGASVWGLLFEVSNRDWPVIQHKEGAVTGMCVERPVTVSVGGERLEAVAFATAPQRASSDGPVSPRFLEALVRGARSSGLPEAWIDVLARGPGIGPGRGT